MFKLVLHERYNKSQRFKLLQSFYQMHMLMECPMFNMLMKLQIQLLDLKVLKMPVLSLVSCAGGRGRELSAGVVLKVSEIKHKEKL